MTHLEYTTDAPYGQDGSWQDKSIAATLPYTQTGTPSTLAGLLDSLVADLPGVKAHGHDSFRFWCTQEHKKRHAPAWVAVLDGKVRIGCYDDQGHNDDLWRQHVGPYLVRDQSPRDWLAPLAVAGVSRVASGQFADAIIYGPIWAGPYLLPIEQRELDRRDELAELAGYNLLRGAIADQMGQALPTLSLSQYQDQPTIGQMLRQTGRIGRPEPPKQEMVRRGIRDSEAPIYPAAPKVYVAPGWVGPYCLIDTNVKRRQRSDSQQVQTGFNCGDCGPCLANWQYRKRHKYEWLTSGKPEQTIVIVSGLIDDDVASAAAIAIGRAGDADRSVFLVRNPLTYHWDTAVVFHCPLSPKERLNIQRGRDRAGQDCTIETRAMCGLEIVETWVPTKKRTPGYHQPCRFVAAGIAQPTEREYAYSDGFVVKAYGGAR